MNNNLYHFYWFLTFFTLCNIFVYVVFLAQFDTLRFWWPVEFAVLITLISSSVILIWWMVVHFKRKTRFEDTEYSIKLPGGIDVKIKPNYDVVRIAHKVWVELATRKAALKFDEDNDLIEEVYNSWYDLFKELRSLAKEVPAESIRDNSDTKNLLNAIVFVINDGLRPHLTKYQARFRHWLRIRKRTSGDVSPQDIQKEYEHYDALVADLHTAHLVLNEITSTFSLLAHKEILSLNKSKD